VKLAEIADLVDAELVGDSNAIITGLGAIETATVGELTHLSGSSYRKYLASTLASAVILQANDLANCPTNALVVENPYHAFAVASMLFERRPSLPVGIEKSASVDETVSLGVGARIGAFARIEHGATLADGVEVGSGVHIGAGCVIGTNTVIMPRAVLYHGVHVGARCVIHSGAVIGADGFGFAPDAEGQLQPIAQIGSVRLGDDVSVGACTTIDRGTIEDTIVGDGVKIDNQVQIGHNCQIGDHTVLCGCVGMVGSTVVGRNCMIGGAVGVGGDGPIRLTDGVMVSAMTHVSRSIEEPGLYSGGVLHDKSARWKRNALRFGEIDRLAKRIRLLEKKTELES